MLLPWQVLAVHLTPWCHEEVALYNLERTGMCPFSVSLFSMCPFPLCAPPPPSFQGALPVHFLCAFGATQRHECLSAPCCVTTLFLFLWRPLLFSPPACVPPLSLLALVSGERSQGPT